MFLKNFGAQIVQWGGSMTSVNNEQTVEWLYLVAGTNLIETSGQ